MRVLHGADFHIGLTRMGQPTGSGNSRVDDMLATLTRFVDTALERDVDVVVFAGDTFHSRQQSPYVRGEFARQLHRLDEKLCVICGGNHDGAATVGDPSSHSWRWLNELRRPNVVVPLQPLRNIICDTPSGPVDLTVYPYPHKRSFDTLMPDEDPDTRVLAAGAFLGGHIREVGKDLSDHPRLFVGHLTVGGATVGSETSMKFTWDVAITPDVLDAWDYAALGHIHKQQLVPGSAVAWYSGSPDYIDFGEVGQPKGWLLATLQPGQPPVVERIPSGARPAAVVELQETEAGWPTSITWTTPDELVMQDGPMMLVKWRAKTRPTLPAIAQVERSLYAQGASFVRSEVIIAEAPAPERIEVEVDLTIEEMTRRWLEANGKPLEPQMTAARQLIAAQEGGPT